MLERVSDCFSYHIGDDTREQQVLLVLMGAFLHYLNVKSIACGFD